MRIEFSNPSGDLLANGAVSIATAAGEIAGERQLRRSVDPAAADVAAAAAFA